MPPSPFRPAILDRVVALLLEETAGWRPGLPPEIARTERLSFLEAAAGDGGSRGKALYAGRCAQCHGTLGDGRGFNAAFLPVTPTVHADGEAMSLRPDDTLHDGIAGGGRVLDRSHRMPAFGRALAPAEIRSLVAYIRELCGCRPPGWSVGGAP